MIRAGPSGWAYDDWAGIVYPEPRPPGFDPLTYLAHFFDTVEINSTFRRPVRRPRAWSWEERVMHNPNFRFTAKLWARFTHSRIRQWSAEDVGRVRVGMDILMRSGRLGAMLLHFPWSFRRSEENRERLDVLLAIFRDYPLVLEVHHSSWNEPEFLAELAEQGVGLVNAGPLAAAPSASRGAGVPPRAPTGFIRVLGPGDRDWHRDRRGRAEPEDTLYSAAELEPWIERARETATGDTAGDTYVVTANSGQGKAVANALMLRAALEGRSVPAPPALYQEYAAVLDGYAHAAPISREG